MSELITMDKRDLIKAFRDYQKEWLYSHHDFELSPMLEEVIAKFLDDTAERFMVEKSQLLEEGTTKDATYDSNSRKELLKQIDIDSDGERGFYGDNWKFIDTIESMPSAQPERLTDDDFETIRLHLNAQKEKLCNQRRWEEAKEYQRIIDRFMAFASAEPGRKTAEWIYGENGGQDGWYCSRCGLFIPWDYEYYGLDNIDFIADFHTCPKCDRKMLKYTGMRGEQE